MPVVLMNFQHNQDWVVHFIQADCRTTIGSKTRYFQFATLEDLRDFVIRCHPEGASLEEFDHNVRAWSRGSIYVNLSAEQYAKLAR
jgi:hypothetical protein